MSTRTAVFVSTEHLQKGPQDLSLRGRNLTLEEKIFHVGCEMLNDSDGHRYLAIRSHVGKMLAPAYIGTDELASDRARQMIYAHVEDFDAGSILPVVKESCYTQKTKVVTVKLTAEQYQKNQYQMTDATLEEFLPEEAKGRIIGNAFAKDPKTDKFLNWNISSSVEVERVEGKARTVYVLSVNGYKRQGHFDTKPQAIREAQKEFENSNVMSADITAQTLIGESAVSVKMVRRIKSATTKRVVTYAVPKKVEQEIAGYWIDLCHSDREDREY